MTQRLPSANDWYILRTAGPRTLPLFRSLLDAGFDVWTPVGITVQRRGRARVRVEVEAPIMPTFVFARSGERDRLARIASSPISAHPRFSIFHHEGSIPFVRDSEIAGARRAEEAGQRAAREGRRQSFAIGEKVRVTDGAAAGLSGTVTRDGDGKFVLVAFENVTLKIGAWLLGTDRIQPGFSSPPDKIAA